MFHSLFVVTLTAASYHEIKTPLDLTSSTASVIFWRSSYVGLSGAHRYERRRRAARDQFILWCDADQQPKYF
jgi:hypothetical protein